MYCYCIVNVFRSLISVFRPNLGQSKKTLFAFLFHMPVKSSTIEMGKKILEFHLENGPSQVVNIYEIDK
jgi:hypothetical protein